MTEAARRLWQILRVVEKEAHYLQHEVLRRQMGLNWGSVLRFRSPLPATSRSLGGPGPLNAYKVVSRDVQVVQRTSGIQPVGILHEPFVSYLHEPEDALDKPDGMFDLGARARRLGQGLH